MCSPECDPEKKAELELMIAQRLRNPHRSMAGTLLPVLGVPNDR
jgi:hypothetical protein